MGLAASQARFLSLTARKTNVEYEGQQINQQRTALANQSAGLFNQMLALEVPTPPSASDYTKTYYTFNDIASSKTITVDHIRIDEANSVNGKIIASVETTQKEPITIANWVNYSGVSINKSDPKEDGNSDYFININGMSYTLTGPTTVNGLVDEFNDARDAYGEDAPAEAKAGDKYFTFTDTASGAKCYIPLSSLAPNNDLVYGNDIGTLEDLYEYFNSGHKPQSQIYAYSTIASTKTTSHTYEDAQLISANDGTGRYESIIYTDEKGKTVTCALTLQTIQDDEAYEKAMQTYEAKKDIYDKAVADIDAKTTIIQQQDKTLELHLQQLDTEQQAIQTEMESIKKVIDKNIDETFKAFA